MFFIKYVVSVMVHELISECPILNVSRGNLVYSEDGSTANLICSEGYFSNITSFRCQNGKWSANHVECVLRKQYSTFSKYDRCVHKTAYKLE